MKITIHEAVCDVGYAAPIFRNTNLTALNAEIATVCRDSWTERSWESLGNALQPPPIPDSDEEVIALYFTDISEEDTETDDEAVYVIARSTYELDIGPPLDTPIDLSVEGTFEAIRTSNDGGEHKVTAMTCGKLLSYEEGEDDWEVVSRTLTTFVLALTGAGFPIHHPAFKECLQNCCETLSNEL